jgi:DNA-binding transcriptional regulator LsrR (DeoR family)
MKSQSNFHAFKTRQQIAEEFGISAKSLIKKIEKFEISLPNGLVSIEWQKKIYESLGYPQGISKRDYTDNNDV